MKLHIFTLVLDGMPFITRHLPVFEKLKCDWRWTICEGTAQNNGSTSWCQPQEPRISNDGTHEYLVNLADSRVHLISRPDWSSKDMMVCRAIENITEPGVLLQCDVDEFFSAEQLEKIVELFESDPVLQLMQFACRYFVGPDLVLEGKNCYGDYPYEWNRAWKFSPGMKFKSHEPPIMDHKIKYFMDKDETRRLGLVFDHYAYATEAQVAFKEKFYGYTGAVEGWRRLQAHDQFPVPLRQFFSWVPDDRTLVERINLSERGNESLSRRANTVDPDGVKESAPQIASVPDVQSQNSWARSGNIFAHSGDLGDCISSFPSIRALGGGSLIITDGAHGQRESMKGARFDAIRPLLEAQSYITSVRWEEKRSKCHYCGFDLKESEIDCPRCDPVTNHNYDFRGFRKLKAQMQGVSLAQWQWQYIGLEGKVNLEPWLSVEPDESFRGMAVFARTLRYHNPYFPWRELLSRFGDKAVFVGLQSEWEAFKNEFGNVGYLHTSNLLDLAGIIAGCKLFIGNQSAPFWLAAGLGVPIVQETWSDQNSIVNRPNAIYSRTEYETSKLMEKIEKL